MYSFEISLPTYLGSASQHSVKNYHAVSRFLSSLVLKTKRYCPFPVILIISCMQTRGRPFVRIVEKG